MNKTVNGLNINYVDRGEGDIVVILHGWGSNITLHEHMISILAQKYRVLAMDMPGFGESDEPKSAWCVDDYVDFVLEFLKEYAPAKITVMGHSFGGRISIIFASRNKVSRVVLVDAAGIKPKRPFKYYWKVYTFKMLKWLCNTFLPRAKAQAIIDRRRKGAGSSDYNNASPKMRAILSKVVNEDLTHLLPKIKAPTLLFWGNQDTATPLCDAKTMERLIPDAGLVVAHGTGHFSFIENAGLFTAVMKNFFNIK